jgi:hypothetical protein
MPSPFPGVDPYLESQHFWPDFHARFMNYWCEALADQLPENYEARMDEYCYNITWRSNFPNAAFPLVIEPENEHGARQFDCVGQRTPGSAN